MPSYSALTCAALAPVAIAAPAGTAFSTSPATMRPRGPEPEMRLRSMPRSEARRRARGVVKVPLESLAGPKLRVGLCTSLNGSILIGAEATGTAAGVWMAALGAAAACGTVGAAAAFAGAAEAVSPAAKICATTAPTLAVSPTPKLIAASVPALVAGTSIEVLSVSISNRLSPGFTASPAALNHFVILPSATVSPSCGIRTSIPFPLTLDRHPEVQTQPDIGGRRPAILRGSPQARLAPQDDGIIYQTTDTYCVSWNSFMPSCAPSRPRPDCLTPPNGAAGSDTRPRFKPIMPNSSFSETRIPRDRSLVKR